MKSQSFLSWFRSEPSVSNSSVTDASGSNTARAPKPRQTCSEPAPRLGQGRVGSVRRPPPAPVPIWRIRYEGQPYVKPCQTPAEDAAELVRWLQRTGYDDRWVSSPDIRELYEGRCRELGRRPYGWHQIGQQILRLNDRQKKYGRLNDGTRVRAYYVPPRKKSEAT